MPVKRRLAKRRTDSSAEIAAWSTAFECEFDFFHDLELFGLFSDAEVKAAAPAAWKRLGHAFLATWTPKDTRETSWALDQFGSP